MKKFFQLVALLLVLPLLAPPAFATMRCGDQQTRSQCAMTCCDGGAGMQMPMASMPAHSSLAGTECCVLSQQEATPPANWRQGLQSATTMLLPVVDLLAGLEPPATAQAVDAPPGPLPPAPDRAQLGSFLI